MSREDADLALVAFSKKIGIPALAFDKNGTALLAFGEDQELIFYFSEELGQIQIWSPLADLMLTGKTDIDAALLQYLLERNFPCVALKGAYFAIDSEVGIVLLGRSVPLHPQQIDLFVNAVTAFAQQVLTITARIPNEISDAVAARLSGETTDTAIIKV